jgi:hypothetical protein
MYSAKSFAKGSAYTSTNPASLVTSSATATATASTQEQAQNLANETAQQTANSVAQNDANVISQALNLSIGYKNQFSELNNSYSINNYEFDKITSNHPPVTQFNSTTMATIIGRNILNSDESSIIGYEYYNSNLISQNSDNSNYTGKYDCIDVINNRDNSTTYIHKHGLINLTVVPGIIPLEIISFTILSEYVGSVQIKNNNSNISLTNISVTNSTSDVTNYTTYKLNFDNAIIVNNN